MMGFDAYDTMNNGIIKRYAAAKQKKKKKNRRHHEFMRKRKKKIESRDGIPLCSTNKLL